MGMYDPIRAIVVNNALPEVQNWLDDFVQRSGAIVGSVNLPRKQYVLVASHRVPASIQNAACVLVPGKGTGGTALQRKAPVNISDIQTDQSGVAPVGSRESHASGILTMPIIGSDGEVLAVVGIGFEGSRTFTEEEIAAFVNDASSVLRISPSGDW